MTGRAKKEREFFSMFSKLATLSKAWIFTLIVMLLGTGFALLPGISSTTYMLTPAIAVMLMLFVVTRDGYTKEGLKGLGLHRLGLKKWGFALLVPLAVQFIGYSVLWLTGIGVMTDAKLEGISPSVVLAATIPILLINMVTFSLTEEIGWRGYLLPKLLEMGRTRALLISGFIHACWHLPFILFTTLYHAEGSRWIVLPLFVVTVTVVGIVFGYLRIVTGSVWPAVLIHAAHNTFWSRFALFTESDSQWSEILTGDTGIIQLALYTLIAWYLIRKLRKSDVREGMGKNG
jgi:membrane protease YdiL (CAAX protease family)